MISTFTIHKIDCQSCVLMIESVAEDTPGVQRAEVRARDRQLAVHHAADLNVLDLIEALAKAGYPVSHISSVE